MKLVPTISPKPSEDEDRRWPRYLFGGRVRTSTLALIMAFLVVWWVYDTYRPHETGHGGPPATRYVPIPPGMQPDPNYTWVPRTMVSEEPGDTTPSSTPTPTTATPTPTTTTTTTPPPPFQLPCIPPFCTPVPTPGTSPSPSQQPQPGPGPVPTSSLPAR